MSADYYWLFWHEGFTKAADASGLASTGLPDLVMMNRREYLAVKGEDTFFFWDELVDFENRVVGFRFLLPGSPTFRSSWLVTDSRNASTVGVEMEWDLCPQVAHRIDGVQGFGSQLYQAADDPRDCALLMLNWSDRQARFPLIEGLVSIRESA